MDLAIINRVSAEVISHPFSHFKGATGDAAARKIERRRIKRHTEAARIPGVLRPGGSQAYYAHD